MELLSIFLRYKDIQNNESISVCLSVGCTQTPQCDLFDVHFATPLSLFEVLHRATCNNNNNNNINNMVINNVKPSQIFCDLLGHYIITCAK